MRPWVSPPPESISPTPEGTLRKRERAVGRRRAVRACRRIQSVDDLTREPFDGPVGREGKISAVETVALTNPCHHPGTIEVLAPTTPVTTRLCAAPGDDEQLGVAGSPVQRSPGTSRNQHCEVIIHSALPLHAAHRTRSSQVRPARHHGDRGLPADARQCNAVTQLSLSVELTPGHLFIQPPPDRPADSSRPTVTATDAPAARRWLTQK